MRFIRYRPDPTFRQSQLSLTKMFKHIPFKKVNWITSSFLIGTLLLSLTAVPWYIWVHGLDWFMVGLFFFFAIATGLSITMGYHRLFSHLAFRAKWPVRLFTLLFGAASFENSALDWASDHRRHHKHCDHDDDPYDISKGFMWAHIGWLMFKLRPEPPRDNVKDLEKDPLVCWQDRHTQKIAVIVGLVLPFLIGLAWYQTLIGGIGALLIAGVLRIVCVQHATFFINSLCHTIGNQPYDTRCSARDSWIMALFTFGEGYHNYHHSFQHDYRNGVKPWHWDPTKWTIQVLHWMGMVDNLRTVPEEKILLAQMRETLRRVEEKVQSTPNPHLQAAREKLNHAVEEFQEAVQKRIDISRDAIRRWSEMHSEALSLLGAPA